MEILDIVAAVAGLCCLLVIALVWRRWLLRQRGVSVDVAVRGAVRRRGWTLGMGRFAGDRLEWFPVFSPALRPSATFRRASLVVLRRRGATRSEQPSLMAGAVVVYCGTPDGHIELAMSDSAVTGFLAWLESAPPGAPLRVRRD